MVGKEIHAWPINCPFQIKDLIRYFSLDMLIAVLIMMVVHHSKFNVRLVFDKAQCVVQHSNDRTFKQRMTFAQTVNHNCPTSSA